MSDWDDLARPSALFEDVPLGACWWCRDAEKR